jgi:hypothetical protein
VAALSTCVLNSIALQKKKSQYSHQTTAQQTTNDTLPYSAKAQTCQWGNG